MLNIKINLNAGTFGKTLLAFLILLWMAPANSLLAQDEPAEEETTEEAAEEEEPEKIGSRLSLSVTQLPGDSVELSVILRAKIDGVWNKIDGGKILFFAIGDEDETPLGEAVTNLAGVGSAKAGIKDMPLNSEGYLTFAARFEGNDQLEESDDEISVLKAILTLTPVKGDSSYTIFVKAMAPSPDGDIPLMEADVVIFIKRMVGRLKVGEGTTDENGEAEIEFPTDLSGDDLGNLFITARIEEFEEYGNLAATTVQPWGKPVSTAIEELPRSLWSPHPPAWMVITFFVLMAAVWGHYGVIVYKLRQIKKSGLSAD